MRGQDPMYISYRVDPPLWPLFPKTPGRASQMLLMIYVTVKENASIFFVHFLDKMLDPDSIAKFIGLSRPAAEQ